jgi:hypothetical protein
MIRNLMRAAALALGLSLLAAAPAQAYTWAASPSKAIWATFHGTKAAGAYGTWYVNASTNTVTFYPNVYASRTSQQGAYAQTTTVVSENGSTWSPGPSAKTGSWNKQSWHQYPKAFALPGRSHYVRAKVSVGLKRRLASDPMHTIDLPRMRY